MSIGPIGSAIYANQQMASVAGEQNAQQNKFELQNLAAAAILNDKDKEVQEVRPTEETKESNEDAQNKQEHQDKEKEKKDSDDKKDTPPLHKLDIKV
nr:hypothetical protein [Sulfurimonas sp. MAG313]